MNLSTGGSYVIQRGSGYTFRVRVPLRIVPALGRAELVRSLQTNDPRLARFLAAAIGTRIDRLWAGIDVTAIQSDVSRLLDAWFRSELERAWRQFQSGDLTKHANPPGEDADDNRSFGRRALGEVAEHRLDQMRAEFHRSDYSYGYPVARQIIADLGMPIDELDQRFTLLAAETMKADAAVQESCLRWSSGDYTYRSAWQPHLDVGAFPLPSQKPLGPVPPPTPAIGAMLEFG